MISSIMAKLRSNGADLTTESSMCVNEERLKTLEVD